MKYNVIIDSNLYESIIVKQVNTMAEANKIGRKEAWLGGLVTICKDGIICAEWYIDGEDKITRDIELKGVKYEDRYIA